MFQERTKKLFHFKKNDKNNQKHIQTLSKDIISDENFKKYKSQKSVHTNTESQTHQKLPSTVINSSNDNNIISINLNILPKEKKFLQNNKNQITDIKLSSSKKIYKTALSPKNAINSKILKKKTKYNQNKTKEKNKIDINKQINDNINESINNQQMNYSMNSSLNIRNLNNKINNISSKNSGIKKILNDDNIQELDIEDNDTININEKNKNNISNVSNSQDINKSNIKNKTNNNINNINVNINYNNNNSPKNKKNIKITENSFSINNININDIHSMNNMNSNIELLIYSKKGYKENIIEIIKNKNVDINYQNENGWTALHYACDEGNLKIAEILIKAHCNINIKNNENKIPLYYSVSRGYFDITKLLIENGGDLNCLDNENNNLIHLCSLYGYDELLAYLINKNPDLINNKNIFGNTPIQLAKKKETKNILEKYIKNDSSLSRKNKSKSGLNNNNNNSIYNNNNNYINSNNPISRIKIHKTNQNQIKALMIPINKFNHKIGANLISINDKNENNEEIKSTPKTKIENIIKISNNKINNKQNFSPSPSGNTNISSSNTKFKNVVFSTKNINLFHYNTSSKNQVRSKKQFNIQPKNLYNSPIKTKKSKDTLNNNSKQIIKTNYLGKRHNTIIKIEKNKLINKKKSTSKTKKLGNKSKSKYEINKGNLVNNINNFKSTINNININYSQNNNNLKNKSNSKTSYNNYLEQKQKKNSKFIKKDSKKKNIDINDNSINNNTKNENNQSNTQVYIISHRTISLPGFMDRNSKNEKYMNENNRSRNYINKGNNNIKLSTVKNSVINKNKNLKSKTKSDLNRDYMIKNNSIYNNNNNNGHNFNKKLSEYKKGNDNININKRNNFRNNVSKDNNDHLLNEKETCRIGQIYTDEEENNLIEDLDEEINMKNNNILINDNNNDYEYGNTMIIKDDENEEKDEKKEINIQDKQRQGNNNISYKNNNNYSDFDDINNIKINEFYLNDKNQNTNINTDDKTHKENNNNIQANDIEDENEYFNNINEMSDSNYSSEEDDNNNPNSIKKVGPSNFICLALLGQGSFGEVYLVQEKNTQNYFAMKVLDKNRIAKQNIFKYAMTERNVLSIINFPFIVKLNYAFQTKEKLFLLLDYCPGGDLSKQLQIQTRFSEDKAKFYICEIALALGELHKKDIIFRDLKPDNIVIDREGHAMLTDFGLSREGVNEKHMAKSFCGSIAYLAPEMLNRKGHGKAVDWYLLGVCFYEMLVGIPPYFSNSKEQIFKNIEKAELFIPNFVSKKAQVFLRDLLRKDPNYRLGSKRDVEEIKEHPFMEGVDWDKVYKREYVPPPIIQQRNYLDFFSQPKIFNDKNDINIGNNPDNYNQILFNEQGHNIYEGWSFVQNANNNNNEEKDKNK